MQLLHLLGLVAAITLGGAPSGLVADQLADPGHAPKSTSVADAGARKPAPTPATRGGPFDFSLRDATDAGVAPLGPQRGATQVENKGVKDAPSVFWVH